MEIKLDKVCSSCISNISLEIKPGEITIILGSNESSKIEIIKLICGLEKVKKGILKYDEKQISLESSPNEYLEIKKEIYHIGDDYRNKLFNVTIKDDLKFYLGEVSNDKLSELLKGFNLDLDILNKSYLDLSSSEIIKILLIIAFMSTAKIIVLENPTLKLDNKSIQSLIKNLKTLKRENKTIIISSYNTNFLAEVSDKLIVLDNESVLKIGNKFEILTDERLLNKINIEVPKVFEFINKVKKIKGIKLNYRDNLNDLIKEIYRNAK